jgi:hypothetical protein
MKRLLAGGPGDCYRLEYLDRLEATENPEYLGELLKKSRFINKIGCFLAAGLDKFV